MVNKILCIAYLNGSRYRVLWPNGNPPSLIVFEFNSIEHTKTKVRHPQTNGSTERLNQISNNQFYKVAFRKKLYTSLEEIQTNLDEFINYYNNERTNQGKYCQGRTPMQTFEDGKELYQKYVFESLVEESTAA